MKKIFLVAMIVLFSLSACVPGLLGGGAEEAPAAVPTVDVAATVDAAASTQAVQTLDALDALATPTMQPAPTEEPTATASEEIAPTEEATSTETPSDQATTETPVAENSETTDAPTETPEATATITLTSTPAATATSVYPSPTSPIAIFLPPEDLVPRHKIEVSNKTLGPVYISLQGKTEYDYTPIIEYDIPRFATVKFEVPEGYYVIVVYVGKDPMTAYTGIFKNNQVSITIYRDELIIKK